MNTPIIIFGAAGKMGQAILQVISNNNLFKLQEALVRESSSLLNQPIPNHDLCYQNISSIKYKNKSVIIDVSLKDGIYNSIQLALNNNYPLLVCATGHEEKELKLIQEASTKIPIIHAPNTSLMLNVMLECCKKIANFFPKSDIAITELHHRYKKDMPSGTSILLANAIKQEKYNDTNISISSIRGGSGHIEHNVYFFNDFEHLELKHSVHDRIVLAQGALIAALFIFVQKPGLYSMKDVINSL